MEIRGALYDGAGDRRDNLRAGDPGKHGRFEVAPGPGTPFLCLHRCRPALLAGGGCEPVERDERTENHHGTERRGVRDEPRVLAILHEPEPERLLADEAYLYRFVV